MSGFTEDRSWGADARQLARMNLDLESIKAEIALAAELIAAQEQAAAAVQVGPAVQDRKRAVVLTLPRRAPSARRAALAAAMGAVLSLAMLTVPQTASTAAGGTSALEAEYDATEAKAVQRNPAFPACAGDITMFMGENPYSDSKGGPVNLTNVVAGGAYLKLFKSGDANSPWGIAMYQIGTDLEVKWDGGGSQWVLPGDPAYAGARPFTEKGQAYGLYDGGFLHNSDPQQFGTFMLINQPWPIADTLTYTPDPAQNTCENDPVAGPNTFVANVAAMEGGGGGGGVPPTTVTLTLDADGGSCASTSLVGDATSWANLPAASACAKDDYVLDGWRTKDGALTFAPGAPVNLTGDNGLVAIWKKKSSATGSSGGAGSGGGSTSASGGSQSSTQAGGSGSGSGSAGPAAKTGPVRVVIWRIPPGGTPVLAAGDPAKLPGQAPVFTLAVIDPKTITTEDVAEAQRLAVQYGGIYGGVAPADTWKRARVVAAYRE